MTKLLAVHYDHISDTFAVVNTVDGRVIDRFVNRNDAEALATRYECIEAQRIAKI